MIFRKLRETSKLLVIIVVVAFALGGTLYGLSGIFGSDQPQYPDSIEQGPLGEVELDETLFTVNEEQVPMMEFAQVLQQNMSYLQGLPDHQMLEFQNQILNFLIQNTVMLQEARARGIEVEVTDSEVDEIIDGYLMETGMDRDQFRQQLARQGASFEQVEGEVREAIREQNMLNELEGAVRSEVVISAEEIKEQFEQVRARNIFVKFEEHDPEEARAIIEEAQEEIEAGLDFAEAAALYSDSPLGEDKGGDLGFIKEGDPFNPLLIEKAFATPAGEVSDIFETDQGYHLLKVEEKRRAEGPEWEQEKAQIEQELWSQRSERHYNEWVQEVMAQAEVEIHIPMLSGFYWMSQGNYDKAVEEIKIARGEQPDNPLINNILGEVYFRKGDLDESIQVYEEAIDEFPENQELYLAFAEVLREKGDYDAAAENIMVLTDLQPDDYYTMLQALRMLQGMDREEEVEEVQAIVDQLEEDLGFGPQQLDIEDMDEDELEEMEEQMEEMLEDPEN